MASSDQQGQDAQGQDRTGASAGTPAAAPARQKDGASDGVACSAGPACVVADLLGCIDEAVLAIDRDYRVISWNRGAERLFGWTAEEMLGRFANYGIDNSVDYETRFQILSKIQNDGLWFGQLHIERKDKTQVSIESSIAQLRNAAGEFVGYVSVHRELSRLKPSISTYTNNGRLFNYSYDAIAVVDPAATIISWNPAAERIFKWTAAESIGKNFWQHISVRDQETVLQDVARSLKERRSWRGEVVFLDRYHQEIILDVSATAVYDLTGYALGFIAIGRDITEAKRADAALRQSEARMRALLHALPDTYWLLGRDGTLLDCVVNGPFQHCWPSGPVLGKKLGEVLPELADYTLSAIEQALRKRTIQYFEYQVQVNGQPRNYEFRATASGASEVLIIIWDVSPHKQVEHQLRESEERFRHLVEQEQVGVYLLQDDRFQYVNPRFVEICGHEHSEILNLPTTLQLVVEPDQPLVREGQRRRLAGEAIGPYTFRLRRKDGRVVDVEVDGTRTIYRGAPALIGTLLDITQRDVAEDVARR